MTLSDMLTLALNEYEQGNVVYFKSYNDGKIFHISKFGNMYKGVPVDFEVAMNVGMYVHDNYRFSVYDAMNDYEVCGEQK